MATLNPDQLPRANAQFIAYGAETRVGDPEGGDALTIRPQVYVNYYRDIRIQEVVRGGRSGKADTVAVHFDPTSVGLNEKITSYLSTNDPLVEFLEQQAAADKPVDVALETARRPKTKTSKTSISPLTPIHALRGMTNPDGSGKGENAMEISGENIRKLVAMANGRPSTDIVSDPTEWAILVSNKAGDLPPEGWRLYAPGEAWQDYGAIVPSGTPARNAGNTAAAGIDPEMLESLLTQVINTVLDERENPTPGRPANGRKFYEGKPWDVRTSDGRIHLGGYAVTNESIAYRWAHQHLLTNNPDEDVSGEETAVLTDVVMAIADTVQVRSYAAILDGGQGRPVEPNRASSSHKEATKWVEWVIEEHRPFPGTADITDEWVEQVTDAATTLLADSGRRVGQWYAAKARVEKEKREAPAPKTEAAEPAGPSPTVVTALLQTLMKSWDKRAVVGNLGSQATERGIADAPVGIAAGENGVPELVHPPAEGQQTMPLVELLRRRWKELGEGADEADGPAPASGEAGTQPPQASAAAPTTEATAEQQPANTTTQPAANGQDANHGYPAAVAAIIRQLHNNPGLDLPALKQIYYSAKEQNLLASPVSVATGENGAIVFGSNGQDGFTSRPLSDVLEAFRGQLEQSAPPQQAPPTSAPDAGASPSPVAPQETEQQDATGAEQATAESDPSQGPAMTIAETAVVAESVEEIDALITQAQQDGVYETEVVIAAVKGGTPRSGPLRSLLMTLRERMTHASNVA